MKRLFAAILGLLFTSVVVLTVGFAMNMDEHGNMADCPYTENGSSMCAMTGLEHLAQWKMNFVAMTQGQNILLLSTFISGFFVWLGFSFKEVLSLERVKLRWRERTNDVLKSVDTLLALLSRGILHPKVYQEA
ncbi:hypothetical protein A2974_02490 [Candidatus Peregrinibacteria bacterium RIFCSPLOWO2_01_FULL_48_20]|nr:MAG: hypothetical protein A2974_02490 [Candidatus Peregrinibacteria bacterium RIFCSPLOWO2_01_FULL_48_20]